MYRKLCSPCISIELYHIANQHIKMSFLFEDKQFFLFLCLRTSKILSLWVFDELKSHLFLVHFSVVFHLKINNYYTEI